MEQALEHWGVYDRSSRRLHPPTPCRYCQQAICGPTRNSFLSGRRPQRTQSWNFIDHFREPGVGANWLSFPGYFKTHGYTSLGGGKTYHPGLPPNGAR
jgi:iduronate 2-sulfatase